MVSNADLPRIVRLAEMITQSVAQLHATFQAHEKSFPTFDTRDTISLPKEAIRDRDAVIDAAEELRDLLMDPMALIFDYGSHINSASLQAISRFKIAKIVPLEGQVSYSSIAKETGLAEGMVQRLLRHAMTRRIFSEPEPGMVAHTRASAWLITPEMNNWLSNGTEVMWPASVRLVDAAQKWPGSQESNETAWALANNTSSSVYDMLASNPQSASRFSDTMKVFASSPEYSLSFVVDHPFWERFSKSLVVDIGGSGGHVAMALAKKYPRLEVVVQDLGIITDEANAEVPDDLRGRVRFMSHDFFKPQEVQADVYYLRWVLHNWSDKACIQILRALVPALRPGSQILLNETVLPEKGTSLKMPLWQERALRSTDLTMGAVFNARERSTNEWRALFAEADLKFHLREIIQPAGSALAFLEVSWDSTV
ncbi:S-adenosyl-L-methionine-dependent methyltransferase [Xylaria cf. heliscus]|nr:S-adenosyl-L-methionine-dependent methyltransferase [Xylaria cf. heliscus]